MQTIIFHPQNQAQRQTIQDFAEREQLKFDVFSEKETDVQWEYELSDELKQLLDEREQKIENGTMELISLSEMQYKYQLEKNENL
ncbi:MAG: hypothetical protein FWD02_02120 [Bacteroidales bacterium]|nr:hypothetical protein [Bacteroidales bacterium]